MVKCRVKIHFMEYPNSLSYDDIMSLYAPYKHRDDSFRLPEKEDLKIQDMNALQAKMNENIAELVSLFNSRGIEDPTSIKLRDEKEDSEYSGKYRIPLDFRVINPDIPISIEASTRITTYKNSNKPDKGLWISLLKSKSNFDELMRHFYQNPQKSYNPDQYEIGNMLYSMIDDKVMSLTHRVVQPSFRHQGIATLLLNHGEAVLQEMSSNDQSSKSLIAHTGQIEVLCWLWKNGYRPQEKHSEELLQKILTGDPNLVLGENSYLFEKTVPPEERTARNYHNSIRLVLGKEFHPQKHTDISAISEHIKSSII